MIEKVKSSYIYYNPNYDLVVGEYYMHCVNVLKKFLSLYDNSINLVFGNYNPQFSNLNKTLKIGLQIEHTILKKAAHISSHSFFETPVKYNDTDYIVRIDKIDSLESYDYVIEYSSPNINHIMTISDNPRIKKYLDKNIHISCNMYDIEFEKLNRSKIITLFFIWSGRRSTLYNSLINNNIQVQNVQNCFQKECLLDVYKNTKILINIHQTDFHDTAEELRILPALMSGVIVIAEDSPLKEKIPYHEFIIWEKLENIPNKVIDVEKNYDFYFESIFGGNKLKNVLLEIEKQNVINIAEKIL
jgi:hypothetical protein